MEAMKFYVEIDNKGNIELPKLEELKERKAEIIILPLKEVSEGKSFHFRTLELLSNITSEYSQITDEEEIDVLEVYKNRERIDERKVSFD